MALPVLMLVLFLTLWVGMAMIRQGKLTVTNRNEAWRQRAANQTSAPFQFQQLGKIERADEATVEMGSLFSTLPTLTTKHAVLGGTWDHQPLPMDRPPHWNLYRDAVLAVPENATANLLGQLGQYQALIQEILSNVSGLIDQVVNQFLTPVTNELNKILGLQQEIADTAQEGYESAVEKAKEQVRKLEAVARELKQEIEAATAALQQAKTSIANTIQSVDRQTLEQLLGDEDWQKVKRALDTLATSAAQASATDTSSNVRQKAEDLQDCARRSQARHKSARAGTTRPTDRRRRINAGRRAD